MKGHHKKAHHPMHASPIHGTRTPVPHGKPGSDMEPDPNDPNEPAEGEPMEQGGPPPPPMPMRGRGY